MSEDNRERRKSKRERHDEQIAELRARLPPIDVGQFNGLEPPPLSALTVEIMLALAQYVVDGATLSDACIMAGVNPQSLNRYRRAYRAELRGEPQPNLSEWGRTCAETYDRAIAIRRYRWQLLAEIGGQGSGSALWMLERRGGREYHAPAQKHEVTRESREVVVTASIDQAIEATADQLGLSADALREHGDYWARAITASQRGSALPAPVIDARVSESDDDA
jgi:hypothetical protein